MAWTPSTQANPRWLADALLGVLAEFEALKRSDPANWNGKLRNAVKILVVDETAPVFAPLRWSMAYLAGAQWDDGNASDWIRPVNRFDALLESSGLTVISKENDRFETLRRALVEACEKRGKAPSAGGADAVADNRVFYVLSSQGGWCLPDEAAEGQPGLPEGAVTPRCVNAYERRRENRAACIAHHGLRCTVCGMDFRAAYGELGLGFIHVHHLVPLADVPPGYVCDPVKDMVPLCPNCHAMIHRQEDVGDVDALRAIWREGGGRKRG